MSDVTLVENIARGVRVVTDGDAPLLAIGVEPETACNEGWREVLVLRSVLVQGGTLQLRIPELQRKHE